MKTSHPSRRIITAPRAGAGRENYSNQNDNRWFARYIWSDLSQSISARLIEPFQITEQSWSHRDLNRKIVALRQFLTTDHFPRTQEI